MKQLLFATAAVLSLLATVGCKHGPGSQAPVNIRVMTYNIHHGRGLDGEVDLGRIANLILEQDVDLVALQEVDKGTQRTDQIDIAAELARLTEMKFVFARNINFQGGEYGNAILSKHPILSSRNRHYKMLREGEQRGLLSAVVEINNRSITFGSTHLDHRSDPSERISNLTEIKAFVAEQARPVILAGDFNDQPDRTVHEKLTRIFTDAWQEAGLNEGLSYPSSGPKSRIDYVFLAPTNEWSVLSAKVVESEASDHLPVVVELTLHD